MSTVSPAHDDEDGDSLWASETMRDLSRLEICLGYVYCIKHVFMYIARHYLCILIRFSDVSRVCTPK